MELQQLFFEHAFFYKYTDNSWDDAYKYAVRNTLAEVVPGLRDSSSPEFDQTVKYILSLTRRGKFPATTETVMGIVAGGPGGPLVSIPRPACMESHLPKGRRATQEEFKEAWRKCQRGDNA